MKRYNPFAMLANPPPTLPSTSGQLAHHPNRRQANLRIIDVREIKTVPYTSISHGIVKPIQQ